MTSDKNERKIAELRGLLERDDAGRLHPEFGAVYDRLDIGMRQTANQIMRTTIRQQLIKLEQAANSPRVAVASCLQDILARESWCTRWSCTTCGAEPLRRAVLDFVGSEEVEGELRKMSSANADKLLPLVRDIDPRQNYEAVVYLLRWVGVSIGEARTKSALGDSAAARLYDRMLAARDRANERRIEHTKSNDRSRIEDARTRRASERAARHQARLEAKRIRDAERRKLHGLQ